MGPAASCCAFRWAAWACGTRITSGAPALRDCQIAEQGPGPREGLGASRVNPTPVLSARSNARPAKQCAPRAAPSTASQRRPSSRSSPAPGNQTRGYLPAHLVIHFHLYLYRSSKRSRRSRSSKRSRRSRRSSNRSRRSSRSRRTKPSPNLRR